MLESSVARMLPAGEEPVGSTATEEVLIPGRLAFGEVQADGCHSQQVRNDDEEVESSETHGSGLKILTYLLPV